MKLLKDLGEPKITATPCRGTSFLISHSSDATQRMLSNGTSLNFVAAARR